MLFQAVQQLGGEAEIALHEILRVLRTVHTGEVEDKIRFAAVFVQLFGSGGKIILEDLVNVDTGAASVFAVPDVFQVIYKGGPHHALCAVNTAAGMLRTVRHRAELIDGEDLSVQPQPLLLEQHRSRRGQPDRKRREKQYG